MQKIENIFVEHRQMQSKKIEENTELKSAAKQETNWVRQKIFQFIS